VGISRRVETLVLYQAQLGNPFLVPVHGQGHMLIGVGEECTLKLAVHVRGHDGRHPGLDPTCVSAWLWDRSRPR
jgi:hypothetical protein